MDLKEALKVIKNTPVEALKSLFSEKPEKVETTEVDEAPEATTEVNLNTETTTDVNLQDEPTEDAPATDEVTVETLKEQLVQLAETVANLEVRVEKLEGGEEEPAETDMSTETNLAKIIQINKWQMDVDQDTFELGTILTVTNEDGDTNFISDGEYELEDGKKIQVDSDGVIVLITEAEGVEDTPAPEGDTDLSKTEIELKKEVEELKEKNLELEKEIDKPAEPVLNITPKNVTEASSYGVKLRASIENRRKELGLD